MSINQIIVQSFTKFLNTCPGEPASELSDNVDNGDNETDSSVEEESETHSRVYMTTACSREDMDNPTDSWRDSSL